MPSAESSNNFSSLNPVSNNQPNTEFSEQNVSYNSPPQVALEPESNNFLRHKKLLILIAILFVIIFFVVVGYLLNQKNTNIESVVDDKSNNPVVITDNTQTNEYVNDRFGFAIKVPDPNKVKSCSDLSCNWIDDSTLGIMPLRFYDKSKIESDDLYCSADGVNGSTYCQDNLIEEFTNSKGISGYKVSRTKTIELSGQPTQVFKDDRVYVFQITDSKFKSVIFDVERPYPENLKILDEIVNTFFYTSNPQNRCFKENGETLTFDFKSCTPCNDNKYVALGSVNIEMLGLNGNLCSLNWMSKIEDPSANAGTFVNCKIPTDYSVSSFQITNYGIDFSPISQFCNQ